MTYDNTNRGTLGRNKRKEKDTHPEYTGKINIEGVEYWLSGWVKESNGEKFFSLAAKRKETTPNERPTSSSSAAPLDDDIPF